MNKTNTQIAKEIKQHRKSKIKKAIQRNYRKKTKNKAKIDKEYADNVENFYIVLPNM